MAELSTSTPVLVVLDVLVRVDGFNHLLVLVIVVLKLVIKIIHIVCGCWVELLQRKVVEVIWGL